MSLHWLGSSRAWQVRKSLKIAQIHMDVWGLAANFLLLKFQPAPFAHLPLFPSSLPVASNISLSFIFTSFIPSSQSLIYCPSFVFGPLLLQSLLSLISPLRNHP